jgi:CRP-like cAMP-binding protein
MPMSAAYAAELRVAPMRQAEPRPDDDDGRDELAVLDAIGATMMLGRDKPLFCEGDAAHSYYKVVAGAVRGYRLLADGRRHITDFFLDGDFIGFHTLATHSFTAETVRAATLVRYDRRRVDAMTAHSPRISNCLLARICTELSHAQTRMLVLSRMTARERLANFLLRMVERDSGSTDEGIELPMCRTDIGDYLGLTTETVCRAFAQLKSAGVIAVPYPHRVLVLQPETLANLAAGA